MKRFFRPVFFPVALLAVVSVLGSAAHFPASARETRAGPGALPSGEVKGENGLAARWKVLREIPEKTKENNDAVWLVVTPSLGGKDLSPLSLEVGGDLVDMWPDVPFVTIADYNFDGHDDVRLTQDFGMISGSGPVYLFVPAEGRLVRSEAFDELAEPKIDAGRKRIIVSERGSACDHTEQEFIVTGFDQLELVLEKGSICPAQLQLAGEYPLQLFRAHVQTYFFARRPQFLVQAIRKAFA